MQWVRLVPARIVHIFLSTSSFAFLFLFSLFFRPVRRKDVASKKLVHLPICKYPLWFVVLITSSTDKYIVGHDI